MLCLSLYIFICMYIFIYMFHNHRAFYNLSAKYTCFCPFPAWFPAFCMFPWRTFLFLVCPLLSFSRPRRLLHAVCPCLHQITLCSCNSWKYSGSVFTVFSGFSGFLKLSLHSTQQQQRLSRFVLNAWWLCMKRHVQVCRCKYSFLFLLLQVLMLHAKKTADGRTTF